MIKKMTPAELAEKLGRLPIPPPPPDLLARLKGGIPADLPVPALPSRPGRGFGSGRLLLGTSRRGFAWSLLAHAAILTLAAGLGWWLRATWVPGIEETPKPLGIFSPGSTAEGGSAGINGGILPHIETGGKFIDVSRTRFASFNLSPDEGALSRVQTALNAGFLPDQGTVNLGDLISAFDLPLAPPAKGDFALAAEGGPDPFNGDPKTRLLHFQLRARDLVASPRLAAQMIAVIDLGEDETTAGRVLLVKEALLRLIEELRPGDKVGLVVAGYRPRILLDPTDDRALLRQTIESLNAETPGPVLPSIDLALDIFRLSLGQPFRQSLVYLGSGAFSKDEERQAAARLAREAGLGIEFSFLGFTPEGEGDQSLERLAEASFGTFNPVETQAEVKRALLEALTGVPQIIATDSQVAVEFNPRMVRAWRPLASAQSGGRTAPLRGSRAGGEIAAGQKASALYEVQLTGRERKQWVASFSFRYRPSGRSGFVRLAQGLSYSDLAPRWEVASPSFRVAVLGAKFGMALADDGQRRPTLLQEIIVLAKTLENDPTAKPIAGQIRKLTELALEAHPRSKGSAALVVIGEATEPELLERVEPKVPAGINGGVVHLRVEVDEKGLVSQVSVLKSAPGLGDLAADAVRKWRYRPAQLNGQPVRSSVTVALEIRVP